MTRPFRSGHCGLTNPPEIHRQCNGSYSGLDCSCTCHERSQMTLRILDVEQRSDEWYAARCGVLTASAIGDLLTPTRKVADNDTSRGLTLSLAAERIAGWTEDMGMTPDMWRGVEHEPFAREKYAENYGEVREVGFMIRQEKDWTLGCSPDGLVGKDGGIEVKCPRAKGHIQTILANAVPDHYVPQIQAALLVSGRKWWDYVSFCAGLPLYRKRVEPDPEWFAAITAACIAFEANVAQIVADYESRVADMPYTERIDLNRVELKLA